MNRQSISKDIGSMESTNFFSLYKENKSHCLVEEYLNDNYSWPVKQLILQLKLGKSHVTYKGKIVKLRSLELFYNRVTCNKCQLCGESSETVYHILAECVHYKQEREMYLKNFNLIEYDCNNYLKLFNNLNMEAALQLYNFFNNSLRRRHYFLDLINES